MVKIERSLVSLAVDRPIEDPGNTSALVANAITHRLAGVLATRVLAQEIEVDPASKQLLEEFDVAAWGRNHLLASAAGELVRMAADLGIRVAILKGLPTESRWYDREGERPSYDIDLTVHPSDRNRVPDLVATLSPNHSILGGLAGLVRTGALQSVDLTFRGLPVDLHWDLLKLELVESRTAHEMWEDVELVKLYGNIEVPAFSTDVSLITHLLHVNKDRFSFLLGFADIARILMRSEPNWGLIERFLRREGLTTPVSESLKTVCERLSLPESPLKAASSFRSRVWHAAWPEHKQLQGAQGRERHRHRQFLIPLTGRGRSWEVMRGYVRRRLFPSRPLLDYYYPHSAGPYLWKLVSSRIRSRKIRRRAAIAS